MKFSEQSRREFFRRTGCAAIGMAAMSAGVKKLGLMNLYAQDAVAQSATVAGYKALVCIFMSGGNDSNNMIVPIDATPYAQYSAVRASSGLALPLGTLLPLNALPIGNYGVHAAMPEIQSLFNLGKLAFATNIGSLVQPTTKTTYQNGSAKRPYQLFSHSDQTQIFQTCNAQTRSQRGWGGAIADRLAALNSGSSFPMVTSVAGSTVFGQGLATKPLAISSGTPLNQVLVLNGFNATPESVARRSSFDLLRTVDRTATLVAAASDGTQESIDTMNEITVDPTLTTVFPNSGLGNQLKQIAKVIKLNATTPSLNLQRQIFFATIGGFDTHQNQLGSHTSLYGQLSKALNAFYNATIELGVSSQVTTFTLSDFGRTLAPSGSAAANVGSDHGWGSHHIIMGDAVKGGGFYGTPGANGTPFPTLVLGAGGPDDADTRGRWVPTSSIDQYASTLGKWFGLQPADNPIVFPLLSNFSTGDLGFMF